MAAGAIGTDTGGSVRIPAALNGLVGFKPTARRVPLDGVLPLSFTLDSAGPIAKTVADCVLLDQVLADEADGSLASAQLRGLRFAVPKTVFQDDLSAGRRQCLLRSARSLVGCRREHRRTADGRIRTGGCSEPAWRVDQQRRSVLVAPAMDQGRGRQIRSAGHRPHSSRRSGHCGGLHRAVAAARALRREINAAASGYDAMLMPTTPDTAPTIAEVGKDDESYFRFNGRMLRNASHRQPVRRLRAFGSLP